MKILNEQMDRLRNVLVTCYNTIKRKGGTIPEAGERNMTNLPAAVQSIPQIHGVLTELEVTTNGVYVPEEGANGFSKVIAQFDTSSLPKVKVFEMRVSNACLDNGYWNGNTVDISNISMLSNCFFGCNQATKIDVQTWDTFNVTTLLSVFNGCSLLVELDISNWDVHNVSNFNSAFYRCISIRKLDLRNWNCSSIISTSNAFYGCISLISLIGGLTEEQVDMNTITCLNGLKVSIDLSSTILDRASIRALINGLADVNDLPAESRPTLTLGTTLLAKLTYEDKAIAAEKGWNLS